MQLLQLVKVETCSKVREARNKVIPGLNPTTDLSNLP